MTQAEEDRIEHGLGIEIVKREYVLVLRQTISLGENAEINNVLSYLNAKLGAHAVTGFVRQNLSQGGVQNIETEQRARVPDELTEQVDQVWDFHKKVASPSKNA